MATPVSTLPSMIQTNQQAPGSVQARIQQIQAASKGLDSAPALLLAGQNDQNLQQQIYRLHSDLKQVVSDINTNTTVIVNGDAGVTINGVPVTY